MGGHLRFHGDGNPSRKRQIHPLFGSEENCLFNGFGISWDEGN